MLPQAETATRKPGFPCCGRQILQQASKIFRLYGVLYASNITHLVVLQINRHTVGERLPKPVCQYWGKDGNWFINRDRRIVHTCSVEHRTNLCSQYSWTEETEICLNQAISRRLVMLFREADALPSAQIITWTIQNNAIESRGRAQDVSTLRT
jgi:hypothetical protein